MVRKNIKIREDVHALVVAEDEKTNQGIQYIIEQAILAKLQKPADFHPVLTQLEVKTN